MLAEAKQEFDREKQIELYKKAQEIIYNDTPLVPLIHTEVRIVQSKKVQGYFLHSSGMVRLKWTRFGDATESDEASVEPAKDTSP